MSVEPPQQGSQPLRGPDPGGEQHPAAPDQTEQHADRQGDGRLCGQCGQQDHEANRCGHHIGGEAHADLPAEPDPIEPATELIEPPLVHLSADDREPDPKGTDVEQHRQEGRSRADGHADLKAQRQRRDKGRDERRHDAERQASQHASDDEPSRGHTKAVLAPSLGDRVDARQHREAARRPDPTRRSSEGGEHTSNDDDLHGQPS